MPSPGIVLELQKDCLNTSVSANSILRKAKVIASKLNLSDLRQWIDCELNGYNCSLDELPKHRLGAGQPKFLNPSYGWLPIQTSDDHFGRTLRTVYLRQSVSELEILAKDGKSGMLLMNFSPSTEEIIQKQLPLRMQVALHFSKTEVVKALDFVRNKTLDWTLQLEERGVTGEGLSFGESEKMEAKTVTNNIYGGNVGILGAVAGNADISGFVSLSGSMDPEKISQLAERIREAAPALPAAIRDQVVDIALELEGAAADPVDARSRLSRSFSALRGLLENTAGNLAAHGILSAIGG